MSWDLFFKEIASKDYAKSLKTFLDEEYSKHIVYAARPLVFNAINKTKTKKKKVVIIGQDP